MASMWVGLSLPAGIAAMQPTSEVLRTASRLFSLPFQAWGGVYQDGYGTGYGLDYSNVAIGIFGNLIEHDLVVPTASALGTNQVARIVCSHSDYLKAPGVQSYISRLS